jgi:hypothetical protein
MLINIHPPATAPYYVNTDHVVAIHQSATDLAIITLVTGVEVLVKMHPNDLAKKLGGIQLPH